MQAWAGLPDLSRRGQLGSTAVGTPRFGLFIAAIACAALAACKGEAEMTPPEPVTTPLARALASDDREAVRALIDPVLGAQDKATPRPERMEALRQWIETQDGISKAEVNIGVLRTDPPVQQVWVTLESDPDTIKTIGIVLDGEVLRFNIR